MSERPQIHTISNNIARADTAFGKGSNFSKVNSSIFMNRKMLEFFEMSPFSRAEKQPDFKVTLCIHFDTTNIDFTYIESE